MVRSCNEFRVGSKDLRSGSLFLRNFGRFSLLLYRFITPSSSSIIRSINDWSDESIGAIDMSRTALNLPQLFRCSFSNRKKFQTNRLEIFKKFYFFPIKHEIYSLYLNTSNGATMDVIMSPLTYLNSVKKNANAHMNRRMKSSMMAK